MKTTDCDGAKFESYLSDLAHPHLRRRARTRENTFHRVPRNAYRPPPITLTTRYCISKQARQPLYFLYPSNRNCRAACSCGAAPYPMVQHDMPTSHVAHCACHGERIRARKTQARCVNARDAARVFPGTVAPAGSRGLQFTHTFSSLA